MKNQKLPKCKSETINEVINAINQHYGFTQFEIQWEISLSQWDLRIREISYNPFIHVTKDNQNIVLVDVVFGIQINITDPNWKQMLFNAIDMELKNNQKIKNEREANGFNNILRAAGLYELI